MTITQLIAGLLVCLLVTGSLRAEESPLADAAENIDSPWLFPPTYSDLSKELTDGIARVTNGETTLPDVLAELQESSLSAFEQAGIDAVAAS